MRLLYVVIILAVLAFFSGAAVADVATVQMKDYKFQPAQVTIKSGGTVTWTNQDPVLHDVSFPGSKSPDLKKGQQYSKAFDRPGTYSYICEIHPSMKGTVVVI